MSFTYATVCSGIECVSQAWLPLGMRPVFFSEIDPFPKAVLAHRYPSVPDLGDLTEIDGREWHGKINVFWGSTPCQAFSFAGARKGVNDPRGALTMKFVELADQIEPDFVAWENVKGVFSDDKNAFGHFLGALAGENEALIPPGGKWTHAGYVLGPRRAIAWRVLNAQYGGVAQRRHRCFLVACPRDGADPREILFERDGPRRDTAPSYETPKSDPYAPQDGFDIQGAQPIYTNTDAHTKVSWNFAYPLKADQGSGGRGSVAVPEFRNGEWIARLRRLTPLEYERLMGVDEGHTDIVWKGKPAPDSARWKAIGNALSVPDARWIGERILVEAAKKNIAGRGTSC